jgi:hypothetical protein
MQANGFRDCRKRFSWQLGNQSEMESFEVFEAAHIRKLLVVEGAILSNKGNRINWGTCDAHPMHLLNMCQSALHYTPI